MFKKLLVYNWKLFRHSLSSAKILVLITYGLLVTFIFSQVVSSVWVIITMQTTELSNIFNWYTPERGQFILLTFANILWLAQFFFTNIRLVNLEENRKLLTVGYPASKLSQYLTLLATFHPLNLLFSISWFILLMLQFNSIFYIPLALAIVLTNLAIIFSLKFRILTVLKNYQKWLLLLALTILFIASSSVNQFFSSSIFLSFENQLPVINQYLGFVPGGIIAEIHSVTFTPFLQAAVIGFCGIICYFLHRDHTSNTRKGLQAHNGQRTQTFNARGRLRHWLCSQFGNHAGKYLYYVVSHPYNKIQALLFVVFPILYVPYMISRIEELGSWQFLLLFFFMYAPMGFQLIFLGNMFGYEHRELLKEMQFPISFKGQLKQRLWGALVIPLTLLVIVSGAEFIILQGTGNLFSILLGNILIFEVFVGMFLWSTFNRFKKVRWVSFSFSQPVISQPVAVIFSLLMIVFSALFYISYGSLEVYKQLGMLILIIVSGFWISRFIDNIQERFIKQITPHLWNEL